MKWVLISFLALLMFIELYTIKKQYKKVVLPYGLLMAGTAAIVLVDQFELFPKSPLEYWIKVMEPITKFLEVAFKP